MRRLDRRRFLQALAALGVSSAIAPVRAQWQSNPQPNPRFVADPFVLGVASGYPHPGGFVLWTRLAPMPEAPGGGMAPEVVPVRWEVARDETMRNVVASGTQYASPDWAHSTHVEVGGLEPGRWYWYRFRSGGATSRVARTRTAPAAAGKPDKLRFAVASCQHFEAGYFGAYRHIVQDHPDLVVFLGDYIYESSRARDQVRRHETPEPHTLADYRSRHAQYKTDPDLQAAHAAAPWLFTWDDHEVENDYAGDQSENLDHPEWFLARRAAAYKAYYEHMPLRREMIPFGPHARMHSRWFFGNLASFHLLDDRQYRSPQGCPRPARGGSNTLDVAECRALEDPGRTMLGAAQEKWLEAGLDSSRSTWNIVAQQTMMAQLDRKPGPERSAWTDGWDGYPAARKRLVDFIAARQVRNPVVIGGDVHMFFVNEIRRDFSNPASAAVASEFVATGISQQSSFTADMIGRLAPENPHILAADNRFRGYLRMEVTPARITTDLRGMEGVATRDSACTTSATYVVEDGKPGPQKA